EQRIPRWLFEGIANFMAHEILSRQLGESAADKLLSLDSRLEEYSRFKDRLDLGEWKHLRSNQNSNEVEGEEKELILARYTYATKAVQNIVNDYGVNILATILENMASVDCETPFILESALPV